MLEVQLDFSFNVRISSVFIHSLRQAQGRQSSFKRIMRNRASIYLDTLPDGRYNQRQTSLVEQVSQVTKESASMIFCRLVQFCAVLMTTFLWVWPLVPVLAQSNHSVSQHCDDAFADIYFMKDAKKYPTGLSSEMAENLPGPHVRLPRALLQLRIGRDEDHGYDLNIDPSELCSSTAFAALDAFYADTPDLARRLGLKYEAPSPHADQIIISGGHKSSLVDDSSDREGMANTGAWVLDDTRGPHAINYSFCLPPIPSPPVLHASCYVTGDNLHMDYTSGEIELYAQPFASSTFSETEAKQKTHLRYITVKNMEMYFAFLRSLAATVIIDHALPKNKQ